MLARPTTRSRLSALQQSPCTTTSTAVALPALAPGGWHWSSAYAVHVSHPADGSCTGDVTNSSCRDRPPHDPGTDTSVPFTGARAHRYSPAVCTPVACTDTDVLDTAAHAPCSLDTALQSRAVLNPGSSASALRSCSSAIAPGTPAMNVVPRTSKYAGATTSTAATGASPPPPAAATHSVYAPSASASPASLHTSSAP
ncbi:hypothetical protein NESM_000934600 [Novymonas esmeraldas]|uniref:Uncharacterized protein n=1 Tax=Novymonas esmeraldas TaxID=1808958 RepID=A0AAW0F076_9TRYP